MTDWLYELFGITKPVIAMPHLPLIYFCSFTRIPGGLIGISHKIDKSAGEEQDL